MLATRNHLFLFSQIIHRSKYEEAYESLKEESISYINITQISHGEERRQQGEEERHNEVYSLQL